MDRSSHNHTGHDDQPEQSAPSPGSSGVKKERETKEDGRYVIFYTFEGGDDRGGRAP